MHNKGRMRQAYEINYSKRSETWFVIYQKNNSQLIVEKVFALFLEIFASEICFLNV